MENLKYITRCIVRPIAASVYWYVVLGVFAAGFGLARLIVPSQSISFAAVVGALLAGPLIIGAVWSRLTGLKILGVDLALSKATVLPMIIGDDSQILAEVDFASIYSSEVQAADISAHSPGDGRSDPPARGMAEYVDAVIQSRAKIVTVNLRRDDYWWSTRLFLLAALLDDLSEVDEIVFVAGGDECRFVAMASPGAVRRALAWRLPILELRYAERRAALTERPASVGGIFERWRAADFGVSTGGVPVTEREVSWVLSASDMAKQLVGGSGPEQAFVAWDRDPCSPLLGYRIIACDTPYVALLYGGRLDKIVDRVTLASSIVKEMYHERLV